VKSSFTGSFDLTSAGTGFEGSSPVSFANIFAQAKQSDVKAKQEKAALAVLAKKFGLGGFSSAECAEYNALAQAGPAALDQTLALSRASVGQLNSLTGLTGDIGKQGAAAGTAAANINYVTQIGSRAKQVAGDNVAGDNKVLSKDFTAMRHDIRELTNVLEKQPVIIKVDSREIAREPCRCQEVGVTAYRPSCDGAIMFE
jgi:hypothetical protein